MMRAQGSGLHFALLLMSAGVPSPTSAQPATSPVAAFVSAPTASDEGENTVGEIDDDVAQVRFQKLGYTKIGPWTRDGEFLQATGQKDGKTWRLRIHRRTGAIQKAPI